MKLDQRIALMEKLGMYMKSSDEAWQVAQQRAFAENNWFIPEFITRAATHIADNFLSHGILKKIAADYDLLQEQPTPKKVGIVLAGNIPLVGFHDVLCTFLTGHYAYIKPSSKDEVLVKHLVQKLTEWQPEAATCLQLHPMLKGCNAYIATGSNNTSRYFEHYFKTYPSIIRKNRTSVAILTGTETDEELEKLADDVHLYFGLGCRNVTKLYVPQEYDFVPLLNTFRKYNFFSNHNKYKNNYDYNLAIHLLNNTYYMTNDSILLIENESAFSPISQLHYQYYQNEQEVIEKLKDDESIQCVVGKHHIPFGEAQCPQVTDFADGVDTMAFLKSL